MSYHIGVDLGTTYTAAAVHRDGKAAISTLGGHHAAIPSVVFLRSDGVMLTGDAAERRAGHDPQRVAREFKRRLGDPVPLIVGGAPLSADALMAELLKAVVAQVEAGEGGAFARLALTYPANWGHYKKELLDQIVRLAGLDRNLVDFVTEPEAAALSYAAQERVETGENIAVYDLGGGTFDAAVLQRTGSGFSILGRPEGIERLGGIDFDAAVFRHVDHALGGAIDAVDPEDDVATAAVARLRRDCVEAKEALSSDADTSIAVMLPGNQTQVRITRHEFEAMIRPALSQTIEAMRRAVASAELEMEAISRVLLVGGSSRIPIVGQMVTYELNRPIAVDTHPKYTVAIGAAYAASGMVHLDKPGASPASTPTPAPPVRNLPVAPVAPVAPGPKPGMVNASLTQAAPPIEQLRPPVVEPSGGGRPGKAKRLTAEDLRDRARRSSHQARRPAAGASTPGATPDPGAGQAPPASSPTARQAPAAPGPSSPEFKPLSSGGRGQGSIDVGRTSAFPAGSQRGQPGQGSAPSSEATSILDPDRFQKTAVYPGGADDVFGLSGGHSGGAGGAAAPSGRSAKRWILALIIIAVMAAAAVAVITLGGG